MKTLEHILLSLERQKGAVQDQLERGIITSADATNETTMILSKERKIKEQMVAERHVTTDGTPRKIEYKDGKQLWMTMLPGKRKVYAKTRDGLIEKLVEYYSITIKDYRFEAVFELAMQEKASTQCVALKTLQRDRDAYNKFFAGTALASTDIRNITGKDLQVFTKAMVTRLHPTQKAFKDHYKHVLHIIFDYALTELIIDTDPVLAIKNSTYYKECDARKPKAEEKILSPSEIELVKREVRQRMSQQRYGGYFVNGYAILLSIETAMRVAELLALKWDDISDTDIWIHAQQLSEKVDGVKRVYYAPWTKNERGISHDGRYFPVTPTIHDILTELKAVQDRLGIESEYVFCHENGEWVLAEAYESCLRRLMKSLGLNVTNNHSFRMSLNSNVLIPLGIDVVERARLLGHSVEVNLKYYTHQRKDALAETRAKLSAVSPSLTPVINCGS